MKRAVVFRAVTVALTALIVTLTTSQALGQEQATARATTATSTGCSASWSPDPRWESGLSSGNSTYERITIVGCDAKKVADRATVEIHMTYTLPLELKFSLLSSAGGSYPVAVSYPPDGEQNIDGVFHMKLRGSNWLGDPVMLTDESPNGTWYLYIDAGYKPNTGGHGILNGWSINLTG